MADSLDEHMEVRLPPLRIQDVSALKSFRATARIRCLSDLKPGMVFGCMIKVTFAPN